MGIVVFTCRPKPRRLFLSVPSFDPAVGGAPFRKRPVTGLPLLTLALALLCAVSAKTAENSQPNRIAPKTITVFPLGVPAIAAGAAMAGLASARRYGTDSNLTKHYKPGHP